MASSKQPVKLVDPTTDANELAITSRGSAEIEGTVADGATAAGVQPVIIGGVDESGDASNVFVTTDGAIKITAGSGTPTIEGAASVLLAAAASSTISGSEVPATGTTTLHQVAVASEQPFFFTVASEEDSAQTIHTGEMHGAAGHTVIWDVPIAGIQVTGGNPGLDRFQVIVTNNDNNKSAVINATFVYSNA